MADEALRLNAVVVDQFTKPLQSLKNQLSNVTQAPALANMRKDWGNVTKEITGGARALQTSFLPALSGINVASLGAGAAITGMVSAMRKMSDGAVQSGIFRRSIDITSTKLKEMKLLGEVLGQSTEQTQAGLQGLYRTIDQLKNRYGEAFQELAKMGLGKEAMALGAAKTMEEAIDTAIAILRRIPNKERQREVARAMGWEGLEVIANESSAKMLETVKRFARQTSGLSEQAAREFTLNMLIMGKSAQNLVDRSLAPMIPVVNELLAAVAPKAETIFGQLAKDIQTTFEGLKGISDLWEKSDFLGILKKIDRATDFGFGKGRSGRFETEKDKDLRPEQPGPKGLTGPQKEIEVRQKRLEEIREMRTGPVASSLQSDLEKEEIKLREEIKKLRESIERGATTQQQGLQGGGVGAGGLIQPAAFGGGGGGFGGGGGDRGFPGGRFGGLGGGGGGVGVGPALGGTDPSLSGQSGIGPALSPNDPVSSGGTSGGGRDPGAGGRSGVGGKIASLGADPRIAEIVGAAQKYLPPGYTVRSTSGFRGGTRQSFHGHHKALDVQIYDPQGRPILNRGEDPTGLYQRLARGAYAEQLKRYPDMKGRFAWGGAFGTQLGGGGVRDLMHFDFGGERGRYERFRLSRMGPLGDVAGGGGLAGGGGGGAGPGRDRFGNALPATMGGLEIAYREGALNRSRQGGYNTVYGFGKFMQPSKPITDMTIDEIQRFQQQGKAAAIRRGDPGNAFPVGMYQFVRKTLLEGAGALGLSGDTKLTPEVQEKLFQSRLGMTGGNPSAMRKAWVSLHGHSNAQLAKIWAGRHMRRGAGTISGTGEEDVSKGNVQLEPGALLKAGAAGQAPGALEAKGTVNIHLHDGMKDKNAKVNMDGMFQKVNVNRGKSMPEPGPPPI